jgi:hypothetical protein
MTTTPLSRLRAVLVHAAAFAVFAFTLVFAPGLAHAVGTAKVEAAKVKEEDGKWKLKMVIDLGKPPDIPHVPMVFSFTPTMLYERNLTDESPEKPVIIKKPLQNQPAINESMDVGFSNVTGETFKLTKFNFMLRRDRGIEAGEYTLEIKRVSDGTSVGGKIKLILDGDNPIIDRRAISFVGDSGKKKKDDKAAGDKPAGDAPASDKPTAPPSSKEETDAALGVDAEAPPPEPNLGGPDPVPPKQGGCGCELAGEPVASPLDAPLLALALPLGMLALARRRRERGRSGDVSRR